MNPEQKKAIREKLARLRAERTTINETIDQIIIDKNTLTEQQQALHDRKVEINNTIATLKEGIENQIKP